MASRRGFLRDGIVALLSGGVVYGYLETDTLSGLVSGIEKTVADSTGPPKTEVKIAEVKPPYQPSEINKIVLYESGAAEITLNEDHGCYRRIGFGHAKNPMPSGAYQIWSAPEFSGPKTVDVKSVVQGRGPFPSRKFTFEVLPTAEGWCISASTTSLGVTLPKEWVA